MENPIHETIDTATWKPIVAKFQKPSVGRAAWQMTNTLGGSVIDLYQYFLVAGGATGAAGGGLRGAHVHYFSRLRARVVLQVCAGKQYCWIYHRGAHVDAVPSLALGT
jgi:hypothetical protein